MDHNLCTVFLSYCSVSWIQCIFLQKSFQRLNPNKSELKLEKIIYIFFFLYPLKKHAWQTHSFGVTSEQMCTAQQENLYYRWRSIILMVAADKGTILLFMIERGRFSSFDIGSRRRKKLSIFLPSSSIIIFSFFSILFLS